MEWSTACPDWAERLKTGRSIIPPPIFSEEAERALSIFKRLRIVDAPNSPTWAEAGADWIFELVAAIFGSYHAESGERLIKEIFVLIPKKNSKSTLAASIMITALLLNWRRSAGFTILAPTVEVATNAYNPARDAVKIDDQLSAILRVQNHVRTITHKTSDATLKVVAADANAVSGIKSVGTLIDELWLFGKQPNAENMLREALGGLASRAEGFVIYTTTQSDEAPAGVFKQKLDYARKVRDGEIHDPAFLPVLFEHPPEMIKNGDHLKYENMVLVNPNQGYSVLAPFLKREYIKAKQAGEASFAGFMAKHANVELGVVLRANAWPGAEFWTRQAIPAFSLDDLIERSEVVTVGIDGGGLDDLLGLAVVGREVKTGKWLTWCYAWAHPSVLERQKKIATQLKDFADLGELTIVNKAGDDVAELADFVCKIDAAGLLEQIGIDPAGVGTILTDLEKRGIDKDKIIGVSQGWKLNAAIKTAERKLAEGVIVHPGQSLMSWCASNARVEPRGNAILITKQASVTKIDPLMAMFNAVTLMANNPAARNKDVPVLFI